MRPAASAPQSSQEVHQSTAAHDETSQAADNIATAYPGQSACIRGRESGDVPYSLVRQEEAALVLGVTPRCLENWRHRGRGPKFIKVSARCIRYRISDLTQWIEQRVRTCTSDQEGDAK